MTTICGNAALGRLGIFEWDTNLHAGSISRSRVVTDVCMLSLHVVEPTRTRAYGAWLSCP
jgi:hypothetical protein